MYRIESCLYILEEASFNIVPCLAPPLKRRQKGKVFIATWMRNHLCTQVQRGAKLTLNRTINIKRDFYQMFTLFSIGFNSLNHMSISGTKPQSDVPKVPKHAEVKADGVIHGRRNRRGQGGGGGGAGPSTFQR